MCFLFYFLFDKTKSRSSRSGDMRVNLERKPVLLAIVLNLVNNSGANSEPGHSTKVELLHFRKNFILDV